MSSRRVGKAHLSGRLVRVGVADRIRTPLADGAVADRVGAGGERGDPLQEGVTQPVVGRDLERMLTVVDQPEAGLVGFEHRPGQLDDLAEQRSELQRTRQLLGDGAQRPGATELSTRTDQEPRAAECGGHGRGDRAQEGWGHAVDRGRVCEKESDRPMAADQRDLPVDAIASRLGVGRARAGRGDGEAGVSKQLEPVVRQHIDGGALDVHLGAQRLDEGARHGRWAGTDGEAGRHALEDGELGLPPDAAGDRGIAVDGRSVLDQDALDLVASESAISTRVDPIGRQTPGIGPRSNGVRMHAEQRRRLGDAEQRISCVSRHCAP